MIESTGFLGELKRRKVFRTAIAYVVGAWLVLQVADVILDPLNVPDWAMRALILALALGFPIVLAVAWAYDLTRSGLVRDAGNKANAPDAPSGADVGANYSTHGSRDAALAPRPDTPPPSSIAVLPFVDLSPDKDQGYLCDGIAEEIMTQFIRIPGLNVASRTASFRFRGNIEATPADIGAALNVGTMLEGGVRRAGDKLRVSAQLVNTGDGYHLWSDRFEGEVADVLALQDSIAEGVARALRLTMDPQTRQLMRRGRTGHSEAYEYYLRGWFHFHRFSSAELCRARQMFKAAVERDPGFSRALSGLAITDAYLFMYARSLPEYRDEAETSSLAAMDCCPELPETQAARGMAHLINKEYDEAEACFSRALDLDPQHYESLSFYGRACVHQGKLRQAATLFERATRARPEEFKSRLLLPQIYQQLGQTDKAAHWSRQGLAAAQRHLVDYPDDVSAMYMSAGAYAVSGDIERGRAMIERALELEPDEAAVLYNGACFYTRVGDHELAIDLLEKTNLETMSNRGWVENDGDLAPLQDHPRFQALLARLPQ